MIKKHLLALLSDDRGQDLIEYALLGALIALSAMAAMGKFGTKLSKDYTNIGKAIKKAG